MNHRVKRDAVTTTIKLAKAILRESDSVYSSTILGHLNSGDYESVANARVNPRDYTDHEPFSRDYLAAGLLRKSVCLPILVDRAGAAMAGFLDSEEGCRAVNYYSGRNPFVPDSCRDICTSFEATFHVAKEKIRKLLGPFNWNEAADNFGFSGGASTRHRRASGSPFYKFQGKPEVTRNAALLAVCAIWERPLWRAQMQDNYGLDPCNWVKVVDAARFTTVPKTALTDRGINIEPEMNMFLQRGIGAVIRKRLRKVNIDLNDQTLNQHFAKIGSKTGSLATIDLRSASDSVSLSLVEALLPYDWFDALTRTRSECVMLPNGVKHRLEKISSMGNGFTFELESLIFWALASSVIDLSGVSDTRLAVYGDDIICHHECVDRLIEVLEYAGFSVNLEKSFTAGPFRESCGKHYFYGVDVTPFYIKSVVDSLEEIFWLANSYAKWLTDRGIDPYTNSTYSYIVKRIPSRQRLLVPQYFGLKAGLITPFDRAHPRYCKRRQAFVVDVLTPMRSKHTPNGVAAVLHWFQAAGPSVSESSLSIEKGDVVYRRRRRYIAWWDVA